MTIKEKLLKDHLEGKGHSEALDYLYDLTSEKIPDSLSERVIRELNSIVMRDIDREWVGQYRNSNVIICGAAHTPPEAFEIPGMISAS